MKVRWQLLLERNNSGGAESKLAVSQVDCWNMLNVTDLNWLKENQQVQMINVDSCIGFSLANAGFNGDGVARD